MPFWLKLGPTPPLSKKTLPSETSHHVFIDNIYRGDGVYKRAQTSTEKTKLKLRNIGLNDNNELHTTKDRQGLSSRMILDAEQQ